MPNSKYLLSLLLFISTAYADIERKVTIAGYGGNDVFAMKLLLEKTLKEPLEEKNINVSYFAIESDYPKYILNALSSGNAPDAFYVNTDVAKSWISTGQLMPLPEDLVQLTNHMPQVIVENFSDGNQQFAIPKDMNALATVYNKDIFSDADVEEPSDKDTWFDLKDKLREVVDNLGDEGVTGLCISTEFTRFAPFALSTGWKPFNYQKRTILDENFKRAFSFYVSLYKEGIAHLASDFGQSWGGGCFATERAAITIEGSWLAGYLRDKSPNLLYGSTLLPKDPISNERGNILLSAGWAINKNAKDVNATIEVVKLLTNEQAQASVLSSGVAIPSLLSLSNHPFFVDNSPYNKLAQTIQAGTRAKNVMTFSFADYGNSWAEPIQVALSSVFLGQLTEQEAMQEAQSAYDEMFNKRKDNR